MTAHNRMTVARVNILLPALLAVALTACGDRKDSSSPKPADLSAPVVAEFVNPADSGSMHPAFTMNAKGDVYLSWQIRQPDSSLALRYAIRQQETWLPVHTVQTNSEMLASAVDVPTVHELPNGILVANWSGKHAATGYDIYLSHSADSGTTWSKPIMPHRDNTVMEHGFISVLQIAEMTGMVWVDGRESANPDTSKRAAQLALATFDAQGNPGPETFLDDKICDCCHTSSAVQPGGAVVVYRNRSDDNIRDINAIRVVNGKWQQPVPVHKDDWLIEGCPVNGPAVSTHDASAAVAWFTAAHDTARVRVAFSTDTANTFGPAIEINEGFPDGHVGIAMLDAEHALVSWIERKGSMATLRVRSVTRDGTMSAAADVAELGDGKRAGGQPKLFLENDHALLTWTDALTNRIRTARVTIPTTKVATAVR